MSNPNFSQLEAHLERLIEGAFAQMFSKTLRAQDIALQLVRAMELEAETTETGDPRPVAPDRYTIHLHPDVRARLLDRQPALTQILSQHLVELATEAGYRLNNVPVIEIVADNSVASGNLVVTADHGNRNSSTAIMQRVDPPAPVMVERPRNAQLIVNGETVSILEPVVNLGRSRENHIVLDDPFVSRQHAQMRLRFGRYVLFDIQSQSGTFVNDVRIREHQLQSGDVIRMGRAQMVYFEDDPVGESQTGAVLPDV